MPEKQTAVIETQPGTSARFQKDEALAKQVRRNPEAFSELYLRHVKSIYRYHLARTGLVEDAQDLTAQTFLAALENIETYRGQRSFLSWLFGIASHKVADHYRQKRPHVTLESVEGQTNTHPMMEEIASNRLKIAQVALALQGISPERAEAFLLRTFGGLGVTEISEIMGKSEAAVRMLIHRGLCDLRLRLLPTQEVEQ